MSRKTRKLMWSVPLVAAFAIVGVLAAYVMLAPNGASAHEPTANSTPHVPPDPVTGIDVVIPSIADGGRTSLQVSWNAPEGGDPVDEYRVDMSTDTLIWTNVIGGEEEGKDTLTRRVNQILTGVHWAEEPLSRIAHMVTNVEILEATPTSSEPETVSLRCRFIIYRNRVATETDILVGRREDMLRREEGQWRIAQRQVFLDQNVLLAKNLTFFF